MAIWSGTGPELHVFDAEVLLLSQPEGPQFQGQKKVVFIVENIPTTLLQSWQGIAIMWSR